MRRTPAVTCITADNSAGGTGVAVFAEERKDRCR